jgi:hypothetical protein
MKDITEFIDEKTLARFRREAVKAGTDIPENPYQLYETPHNVEHIAQDVVEQIPKMINRQWWLAMNRDIYIALFLEMIEEGITEKIAEAFLVCAFYLAHSQVERSVIMEWMTSALNYAEEGIEDGKID